MSDLMRLIKIQIQIPAIQESKLPLYSIPSAAQSFLFITSAYLEKLSLIFVLKYLLLIANIAYLLCVS